MIDSIPKFVGEMLGVPFFVGRFVMDWSSHEKMLAGLIAALEGRDFQEVRNELLDGQIAAYDERISIALGRMDPGSQAIPIIEELLAKHTQLRDVRHRIIHGSWPGLNSDEEYILRFKPRREATNSATMSAAQIMEHSNELQSVAGLVINARRSLKGEELLEL